MTISRNLSFLAEGVSSTGVLGATYGGTGQSSITTGDLLYGSVSNTISKLAIGSTGTILRVVGGVPAWGTDYTGTVTSVAASVPSFLSISGSPITTSGTLAITYSGTALPIANGGTAQTSFTANQVLYGSFSQSANLYFSGTQLGVGTSSPNALVHAYSSTTNSGRITIQGTGSTAGNYRGINLYNASGFSGGIFQDESSNNLSFWNAAAPLMTLTNAGRLGINITSPSTKLEVQDDYIRSYHASSANTAGYGFEFSTNGGGTDNVLARIGLSQVGTNVQTGSLLFQVANAGAPTTAMTLNNTGFLGIGTSPSYILDIAAPTGGSTYNSIRFSGYLYQNLFNLLNRATGGNYSSFELQEAGTSYSWLRNYGSVYGSGLNYATELWNSQNGIIRFGTNNAEVARIFASGGISIGNTTDPGAGNLSVNGGIRVNGNSTAAGLTIANISTPTNISTVNSTTYNVTFPTSAKVFWISLGSGDGVLCITNYITSVITILGTTAVVVNNSVVASNQLGVYKSANSHVVSFVTGSAASSTYGGWQIMSLSSTVS